MSSDEPIEGNCNAATSDGGYCERAPMQNGRCYNHGGNTPTAEENPKQGRGDQDGNGNAITHGVRADPFNLYQHLPDEHREWVDSLVDAYCEHLEFDEGDPRVTHVKRGCLHLYQANSGESRILEDGLSESQTIGVSEDGQPIVRDDSHHLGGHVLKRDKEARQIFRTLGAFDDPETKKANAKNNLAEVLSSE